MLLEIIRLFRQTVTIELAKDSFRQGWQEAMQGETLPISDLWGVLMLNDETSDFGEVMDDRADYG